MSQNRKSNNNGFGVGIFKNYGVYRLNNTIFWIKRTGANAVDGEIYRLENDDIDVVNYKTDKPYKLLKIKRIDEGDTFNLIEEATGTYLGSISKTFYTKQFYQKPINADPPKRSDELDDIIDTFEFERDKNDNTTSVINPSAITFEKSGKFYKTNEGRYFMIVKDKQNYKESIVEYNPKTNKLIYGTNLKLILDDGIRYIIDTTNGKIVFYYNEGQLDVVDRDYDISVDDIAINPNDINDYVKELAENIDGYDNLTDEDIVFLTETILNDINRDNPSKTEIKEQFDKKKGYVDEVIKDRTDRNNEILRKQNATYYEEQDVLDEIIEQLKIQFVGYFGDTNPFWDEQSRKIYNELMDKGDIYDVRNEDIKQKVLDLSNQLTQKEFTNYIDLQDEIDNVADEPTKLNDVLTTLEYTTSQRLYIYERLYNILEEKGVYNPTDQEMMIVFNQYKEQLEQELKTNIDDKDEVIEDEYLSTSQDIVNFLMEYNASMGDLLTYEDIQEIILSYEGQGDFNVSKTELEKSFVDKVVEVNASSNDENSRDYVYKSFEEMEEDIFIELEKYNLSETIQDELNDVLIFEWNNNDEISYDYIIKKVNQYIINTRTQDIEENNQNQRVYFDNDNKYYTTFINEKGLIQRRYYEKNENGDYQITNIVHIFPSTENPNTYTDSFGNEISKEDLDNLVKAFGYENGYDVVENNHIKVKGLSKDMVELDENGNPIVRDEQGNIIDLTKHDDDKGVVPYKPKTYRDTPHSTQNIYDKNTSDTNDDVKLMIQSSNDRKKEESELKKLEEYKEKNVGLILGEPIKNYKDVLTMVGEVFNTDTENSIMLFSFTKNLNQTETFNHYMNRVQSNYEYTNWKTEIENRATHLDFDSWNTEKNKDIYTKSYDYLKWGMNNFVYGLSSIGSVRFVYSFISNSIRAMKITTAFNRYKSTNVRLRMADTIITRSRRIPDVIDVVNDGEINIPKLMVQSITKFSTQKYTPQEYLIVLQSLRTQVDNFVKDYELKPEDFVKEAQLLVEDKGFIPKEYIKSLKRPLPQIEFDSYDDLLQTVNNVITTQRQVDFNVMTKTSINKIEEQIQKFTTEPEQFRYDVLDKFYKSYIDRFIDRYFLNGILKTESDFVDGRFNIELSQKSVYKSLDKIFRARGFYSYEDSLDNLIRQIPLKFKYPKGRINQAEKFSRQTAEQLGRESTIDFFENIQFIRSKEQYERKVRDLIYDKIQALNMDGLLDSITEFDENEISFLKSSGQVPKLNELFIKEYYNLVQDDLKAKKFYLEAQSSEWIKSINKIDHYLGKVDNALLNCLSYMKLPSQYLYLTSAVVGSGKLLFDGFNYMNSFFQESTDITQTNIIIETIKKMSSTNQEQIYNLINLNNEDNVDIINLFKVNNPQEDEFSKVIENSCQLNPYNDFLNAMNNKFKRNIEKPRQMLNINVKDNFIKDKPLLNENSLFVLFTVSYLKVNVIKLKELLDNDRIIDYFKLNYNIDKKEIERIEFIKHNNKLTKIIDVVSKNSQNNLIQIIFIGLCIISFCFQFDKEYKTIKEKDVYFTNLIMSYVDTIQVKEKDLDTVIEVLIKFYKGHNDYNFNDLNGVRQHIETTINNIVNKFLPRKQSIRYIIGDEILSILNSKLGITMNYTFQTKNDIINYLTNQYNNNTFHMNLNFLTKYIKIITDYVVSFDIKKYFETFNDKMSMNFFNDVIFQNSIFSKMRSKMNNQYEIVNKDVIIEGVVFYDKDTKEIKQFVENQKVIEEEPKINMENVSYEDFVDPKLRVKKEDKIEDIMKDDEEEQEEEIILSEEEIENEDAKKEEEIEEPKEKVDSMDKMDSFGNEEKEKEKPKEKVDSMDKIDTFGNEENIKEEEKNIEEEIKDLDDNKDMILDKEELKDNKEIVSKIKVFSNEAKELNLMDNEKRYKFNYDDLFFRGTDVNSNDEMVKNIQMDLVDFEYGGKVHKGIYSEFKKIIEDGKLEEKIKKLIEDDKSLNIIGHSKGSVLGIYTASYFKNKFPKLKIGKITLFGTPNIFGDEEFKKGIENIKFVNIANSDDPISYFNVKGFYEVKKNIILEKKEKTYKILINQPNPKSYNVGDIAKLTQEAIKGIMNNFENHKLLTYQKLMNNLIN